MIRPAPDVQTVSALYHGESISRQLAIMCACQLAHDPWLTLGWLKLPSIHRRQSSHECRIQNRFVACGLNHHGAMTTHSANIHTDHEYKNETGNCVFR